MIKINLISEMISVEDDPAHFLFYMMIGDNSLGTRLQVHHQVLSSDYCNISNYIHLIHYKDDNSKMITRVD